LKNPAHEKVGHHQTPTPNSTAPALSGVGLLTLSTPPLWRGFSPQTNNKNNNMANIKPLGQRVLVKRLEADAISAGGIVLPDTAKEKPQEAEVLSLGTGGKDDKGKLIEFTVKVGDKVLISKYGGTEVKLDGEEVLIINEADILGIVG
jgi:chaperonin GroES